MKFKGKYIAIGMSTGMSFGVAFGVVYDNVSNGLIIGMIAGMIIGAAIDAKKKGYKIMDADTILADLEKVLTHKVQGGYYNKYKKYKGKYLSLKGGTINNNNITIKII